jgi:hypothetical protein
MAYTTREAWLNAVVAHFKPDFAGYGYPLPERLRVTCGWPSKGALALKARRIGECWHPKASEDGAVEVFISPVLADPIEVGHVLVHELCHAAAIPGDLSKLEFIGHFHWSCRKPPCQNVALMP